MSNFWESTEVIGSVTKNKREEIVISKCARQGKEYLDIRIHSVGDRNVPTAKGFNLEFSKCNELVDILTTIFE